MTDRLDVTESSGLPDPADAGSGEVIASPFPEPAPISRSVEERQGSPRGPDLPRPGRGVRRPHGHHRGDRCVPAVARRPGAGTQRGELLPLRRDLEHHRHVGHAFRRVRFVPGDGVRVAVRIGAGHAGGARASRFFDPVRSATGSGPAGLHGRPAGRVPSIIYGVWGLYVLAPGVRRSRCG